MSEFLERVWYLATHSRLALQDYVDSSIPNAGAYTGIVEALRSILRHSGGASSNSAIINLS